ncbi:hypothetical protein JCM3774_000695 [Rhodotorula dairenensis]
MSDFDAAKLKALQAKAAQLKLGGAKAPIRRKVAPKQAGPADDKKLQTALKKLNVQGVGPVDEVNMFMDDGKVLHFQRPTVHAAAGSNTYAIYGHGVAKELADLMPNILNQLGPDAMASLRQIADQYNRSQAGGAAAGAGPAGIAEADEDDDEEDVPELVEVDDNKADAGAKAENLDDVVVGKDGLEVSLEDAAEDQDRWEDLDLTQSRMNALEREVVRCESVIAHRKEVLDSDANEIFALRCELGLYRDDDNGLGGSTSEDPLDEEILWHLGIGEARQQKKEMLPTAENVQKLEAKRKWLEDEKGSRNETIQTTYDQLYPLWTMLGVTEEEMDDFVNRHMGSTIEVVNAYQAELARMLALKRTNMSVFIQRERGTMTELWDRLYTSYPQRLVEFPAYSISVEPTKVWNAAHGCDELVVSDNVSEELLAAHERERERLEKEVEDAGPMLDRLARYFAIVDLKKQLEAAASDPSRLTDKSRGAAQRLAQEAKDRVRVDREKPKLEAELRRLIPQWEAAHGRPFLVNGVSFIEGLDDQIRAEEQEKENRKRAKLGASVSAGSARPLRPQHTGAAATAAPLKRQMTGASARSATSAASTDPPAAKRFATGPAAPTPSAARIARPKSALGEANGAVPHYAGYGAAPPPPPSSMKPIRAQVTGIARPRAGTVNGSSSSSVVAQTPMTGSRTAPVNSSLLTSVGPGMRLPHGWGASAAAAAGAVDSPTLALGASAGGGTAGGIPQPGMLISQRTGSSFRPMGR